MNAAPASPQRRVDLLHALVAAEGSLDATLACLARFSWDSDEELVVLTRADALRVLHGHRSGRLSSEVIERWADAVECRDDIGREAGFESELNQFLFELATPEINGRFTPGAAERWAATFTGR